MKDNAVLPPEQSGFREHHSTTTRFVQFLQHLSAGLLQQTASLVIYVDFTKAFEQVDAIVTPTAPAPAFKIGEKAADPLQMYLVDIFTISCNLAGLCGLSVPCGFTQSPKLPIGLQLLGKPLGEETILRVAHSYEQATVWHLGKPDLGR